MNMRRTAIVLCALALGAAPTAHADTVIGDAGFLDNSTLALVMGPTGDPTPDAAYLAAADSLYLDPAGFDGTTLALTTPETSDYGPSVTTGEQDLVSTVVADYHAGDFSATDPLTIMGYSQSAVVGSDAEQTLTNDGIPSDALRFLFVGDTASAEGGYLNTWGETPFGKEILDLFGWQNLIGNTTPDDLYPTTVYTITGDEYADYPAMNLLGTEIHEAYFGLTPQMIDAATENTQGLTDYFTVAEPTNLLGTLWDALVNVGY
jgi:hypothetical protein